MSIRNCSFGLTFIYPLRSRLCLHHAGFLLLLCVFVMGQGCGDDDDNSMPAQERGMVTDVEGNTYHTIKIGSQWWMAEDLRTTTFNSGLSIPQITDGEEWAITNQPAYSIYNNGAGGSGLLYNYHVISSADPIAPEGWRVPTDEDWKRLEVYLGMTQEETDQTNWRGTDQGDQLKIETTATEGWIQYDGVWGNNSSGFSATGGSCRVFNGEWGIPPTRHSGYWWTSTVLNGYGWFRYLDYKKTGVFRFTCHPNYGFSIRCIKND